MSPQGTQGLPEDVEEEAHNRNYTGYGAAPVPIEIVGLPEFCKVSRAFEQKLIPNRT